MKKGFKRGLLAVFSILALLLAASSAIAGTEKYLSLSDPSMLYAEPDDVIHFDFKGEDYTIKIVELYTYSVEFLLSGKMSTLLLHEDESMEFNLDDFGKTDLKITAKTIIPQRKATLLIERINAEVPIVDAPPFRPVPRRVIEEENKTNETVVAPPVEEPEEEVVEVVPVEEKPTRDYTKLLYTILIISAIFIVLFGAYYFQLASYAQAGVPPKLIKYVKKSVELKIPMDEMRLGMKDAGWADEEIDLAIKNVTGGIENPAV